MKNTALITISLLILIACSAPESQTVWITHPEVNNTENLWLCFRKDININKLQPGNYLARIAADSKYWLWVNGKMAVFEGGLKRGPNPLDTYYDIVDLTSYLTEGNNNISLLLWHFGKHGFSHNSSGHAGLFFELANNKAVVSSDTNWKVTVHPAYGESSPPHPNFRLPESNIHFDARNDIENWFLPGFDDSDWPNAIPIGKEGQEPFGDLIARPIPLWYDSGLISYTETKVITESKDAAGGKKIVHAYLPVNTAITPYFRIRAEAGQLVDIRTDNYFGGSEYNVRTEYITRDGEQEFETFGHMNGHYVIYTFPENTEILELKYRETGYDTRQVSRFVSDIPFFDLLWDKSATTLKINMRDTYMDCPDRERAQWWGDVTLQMEQSFYVFDRQSDLLARKGILELINWQRPDSTIFSPVPAGNWDNELPMQMLASIGYYGIWSYYVYSGDITTVEKVYPGIKRYINVWQTGEKGLVVPRSGGWLWGDWGDNRDLTLLFNTWYSLALKGFENMAALLGHAEDANWAKDKNEILKEAFHREFWSGKEYRSPEHQGETDDRPHALAVLAGITPSELYPQIRQVLLTQFHASPYMEKYVLEALIKMGYVDDALWRMKKRYEPMVSSDLTTLWEGWGIGHEGFGGGSYNHGWSGGPLTLLSKYIAGISPAKPGFAKIKVNPNPGPFNNVSCQIKTYEGMVGLTWEKTGHEINIYVNNEAETPAIIVPPVSAGQTIAEIYLNNTVIWGSDQPDEHVAIDGVKIIRDADGKICIDIQNLADIALKIKYAGP